MANIGPRAHPESIDVRNFLQNVTNIVQTHFPVPDPKWLFNSKSYSFPRISEFKKAKTFSLYQPQTSVSSHLPIRQKLSIPLEVTFKFQNDLLCHQFTAPGVMLSIFRHLGSWSRLGSVGTFHIKYCKQFIDICPRHLEWRFWFLGLEKTCHRRRIKQLLLTTMISHIYLLNLLLLIFWCVKRCLMDTSIRIKGYGGNSARSFRVSVHLVELAGIEFFPQFQMLQFLSSCLAAGRSKKKRLKMLQNWRPGTL